MASDSSDELQSCLRRMNAGDPEARDALIGRACRQLRGLTRKMLHDYARLRRWEESDDVLQSATLRLCRSLQDVAPQDLAGFFQLAALQIRRELVDLARHHYGPEGPGANHATDVRFPADRNARPGEHAADSSTNPSRLVAWTEFHQQVDRLPAEERQVFDLLWYQGLSQEKAAELLAVSTRTIKRRWQAARLQLHKALPSDRSPL